METLVEHAGPFFRAVGLLLFIPLGEVGVLKKITIAALLAALTGPEVANGVPGYVGDLVVGTVLGAPIGFIISLASSWGALFDLARGQTTLRIFDPQASLEESGMEATMRHLTLSQLLMMGALERLASSYLRSFSVVPNDFMMHASLTKFGTIATIALAQGLSSMCLLFLPWALVFLTVEIAFGFLSRLVPHISWSSETYQMKSALGFILLWLYCSSRAPEIISAYLSGELLLHRIIGP